jgi:hypothetical protein
MLQAVFNKLFACVHRRTTFPRTRPRAPVGTPPRTYVVCLDCGSEIPYDWGRMRVCPPAVLADETKGRPGRGRAGRVSRAIQARAAPDAGPAVGLDPPVTPPLAGDEAQAAAPPGDAGGPAAGQLAPSPRRNDEGLCAPLPSMDDLCGAGALACQAVLSQLRAPHVQPIAQPRTAVPPVPAPRPYLFAARQGEVDKGPNGGHTTAESEIRRYLDRAGLRFRKVQVALRVLNSLMAHPPSPTMWRSWCPGPTQAAEAARRENWPGRLWNGPGRVRSHISHSTL